MEMTEITFSAELANDYLSRHDNGDLGAHEIVTRKKLIWTLRLNADQLDNVLADLEYQIEFNYSDDWEGAKAQARKCVRALDAIEKQIIERG